MVAGALEVADIFRDHGAAWRSANAGHVSLDQFLKVMSANDLSASDSAQKGQCFLGSCRDERESGSFDIDGQFQFGEFSAVDYESEVGEHLL